MQDKLLYAQDLISTTNTSVASGFNMKIMGDKPPTYSDNFYDIGERSVGYDHAAKMAREGKIYYTHVFNCECGGRPFMYGGFFVCGSCGKKSIDEPWWAIRIQKDGNQFCCNGLGFEDLQSSNNYAFGETREEAISNYEKLFSHIK